MRDQMRRGLRTAAISLALCMGSVGSLARADDCSDSLMAESCACQSDVRSDREQSSASDKSSHSAGSSLTRISGGGGLLA